MKIYTQYFYIRNTDVIFYNANIFLFSTITNILQDVEQLTTKCSCNIAI